MSWLIRRVPAAAAAVAAVAVVAAPGFPRQEKKEPAAAPADPAAMLAASGFPTSTVPADIPGGAPNANLVTASLFAWQEFTALNWPAVGAPRDTPDTTKLFGQPGYTGPLVWHTYRHKVEIYPGVGNPNGYNPKAPAFGYNAPPQYIYDPAKVGTYPGLPAGQVPAADPAQAGDAPPWVNLDEMSQIGLNTMFAGAASPAGPFPGQQILFLAKANKAEYTYIASKQWFDNQQNPLKTIVTNTAGYVAANKASPPPGSAGYVSFPTGTIEVKTAWRRLTPAEAAGGRFYSNRVRFYQNQDPAKTYNGVKGNPAYPCYVDQVWGMLALHIIHKTPTAPYFVFATFGQADNLLDAAGNPIEDDDGKILGRPPATTFSPAVLATPATPTSTEVLAPPTVNFPPTGKQLYLKEQLGTPLPQGTLGVNRRANAIPPDVILANQLVHNAIKTYNQANKITSSPWLHYKLVNVQSKPMTKQTPGKPYTGPDAATYYQANIVVETDFNLQNFSGRFIGDLNPSPPAPPPIAGAPVDPTYTLITDFNQDGSPFSNVYAGGKGYTMGGCMGCHGNPQVGGTDFSFIFGNRVHEPEVAGPLGTDSKVAKKFAAVLARHR